MRGGNDPGFRWCGRKCATASKLCGASRRARGEGIFSGAGVVHGQCRDDCGGGLCGISSDEFCGRGVECEGKHAARVAITGTERKGEKHETCTACGGWFLCVVAGMGARRGKSTSQTRGRSSPDRSGCG